MNPFSDVGKSTQDEREIERIEIEIVKVNERISKLRQKIQDLVKAKQQKEINPSQKERGVDEIRTAIKQARGDIDWQNNRSRQANTIIERNF
jgi:predicted  nucleic acid-binding Zn-ribbon protein